MHISDTSLCLRRVERCSCDTAQHSTAFGERVSLGPSLGLLLDLRRIRRQSTVKRAVEHAETESQGDEESGTATGTGNERSREGKSNMDVELFELGYAQQAQRVHDNRARGNIDDDALSR